MKDNMRMEDRIEVYDVNKDGSFGKCILKTNNNPSFLHRLLMRFGLYKCAGDAMMNYGIQHLATAIYSTYGYVSVGISSASPSDYALTDIISPVLTRMLATKSYETYYTTNDTAVFTAVFTPDGTYTIVETGLHDAITAGNMGARQTSCSITTSTGVPFGIIWKITIARS